MSDLPERPALRAVEVRPATSKGERVFELRDPFALSSKALVLPAAGMALLELFDGSRDVSAAQAEFQKRYGFLIEREQVESLIGALDECLLLEGGRFDAAVLGWRNEPLRKAACAGGAYPKEPLALDGFLDAQYTRQGGPGGPPAPGKGGRPVRAVVSPHIDFHRGGHAYAWAWRAVAESCEADTFVIFGTAHKGTSSARYALTRKSYETPLGTIETDQELLERVLAGYEGPDDLFQGELAHKEEHSIEFQMVELAHLYGERSASPRKIRALPVLCGSIHDLNEGGKKPSEDARVRAFQDALGKALKGTKTERVCFVAGVDLAHVGKEFGDEPLPQAKLSRLIEDDGRTLDLMVKERGADPFHADVARDQDARRICGHSAIAATLEALARRDGDLAGELLCHEKWYDGASSVTFASAVWRDRT